MAKTYEIKQPTPFAEFLTFFQNLFVPVSFVIVQGYVVHIEQIVHQKEKDEHGP
jgi:hypothetical protein